MMDVLERIKNGELILGKPCGIMHLNHNFGSASIVKIAHNETEELIKLGKRMQWVSVAERMPEIKIEINKTNSIIVNVLTKQGTVSAARYESDGYFKTDKGREPKWRNLNSTTLFWGEVVMWMPLPPNPGEAE